MIILVIGFQIIFSVTVLGNNELDEVRAALVKIPKTFTAAWFIYKLRGIIVSIIITVFNLMLKMIVEALIEFQKRRSCTNFHTQISKYLYKVQFMNSAILPFTLASIQMNYFGTTGLLQNINFIFVINLFVTNTLLFFDFSWFYKKFQIYSLEKAVEKNDKKSMIMTQEEANELYAGMDFDLSIELSGFLNVFAVCCFYYSMIPFITVYAVITILIKYYLNLYILLNRTNNKTSFSQKICEGFVSELNFCLLLLTLGLIVKSYIISYTSLTHFELPVYLGILMIFAFFNWVFTTNYLVQYIYDWWFDQPCTETGDYDTMKKNNIFSYTSVNPVHKLYHEMQSNSLLAGKAIYKETQKINEENKDNHIPTGQI